MAAIPDHPPPSYLDRDIDVLSMRSAAPSYTSSLPPRYSPRSYSSLIPADSTAPPIPAHHHAYTVASWPSLSNQSQSRAFLNVAARRVLRARAEGVRMLALATGSGSGGGRSGGGGGGRRQAVEGGSVGGGGGGGGGAGLEEALRTEGRAWDFFTAQMSDWEQREVSWKAFRARHEGGGGKRKGKKRGIRWGLYGRL